MVPLARQVPAEPALASAYRRVGGDWRRLRDAARAYQAMQTGAGTSSTSA